MNTMTNHIANLKRATGNTTGQGLGKYEILITSDDILNAFYSSHIDLSYPLRKEVKRDRFIYNSKGLEKEIEAIVIQALNDALEPFGEYVQEYTAICIDNLIGMVGGKPSIKSSSKGDFLVKTVAKGITKGVFKLVDNIIDDTQ